MVSQHPQVQFKSINLEPMRRSTRQRERGRQSRECREIFIHVHTLFIFIQTHNHDRSIGVDGAVVDEAFNQVMITLQPSQWSFMIVSVRNEGRPLIIIIVNVNHLSHRRRNHLICDFFRSSQLQAAVPCSSGSAVRVWVRVRVRDGDGVRVRDGVQAWSGFRCPRGKFHGEKEGREDYQSEPMDKVRITLVVRYQYQSTKLLLVLHRLSYQRT